jgi:anti-sigma factor RsiW
MSCSAFDLRDYVLKELSDPERRQVEAHAKGCIDCREELERLRLTEATLLSLRDEEIPQRIAFVSDKIFEPSPWRRFWTAFWGSPARLGFASAAMLSVALVVYTVSGGTQKRGGITEAPAPQITTAEVQNRIQAAVDQAVKASETRLVQRIAEMQQEDLKERRQLVLWAESQLDYSRRSELAIRRSNYGPPAESGGLQ